MECKAMIRPRLALPLLLGAAVAAAFGCVVDERDLGYAPQDALDDGSTDTSGDVPRPPTSYVDILFVVDNSGSMAQEQEALARGFPGFFDELFAAAAEKSIDVSMNVGVVDTDMGTMGFPVSTCSNPDGGDNGCLLNTPNPAVGGCAVAYPTFLNRQLTDDTYSIEQVTHDFTCMATLGTSGCGFEQQFEAARKALIDNTAFSGCNRGLIREGSVVGVLFVSDEDDCSVRASHPEMFDQDRTDLGHLNIRCFLHPDLIRTVDEYVAELQGFAGEGHAMVVGELVGVPRDAARCTGFGDALIDCLSEPAMQQQIDPAMTTQLIPSCNTSMGLAFPPVRFVQLAQRFGVNAVVGSICTEDYGGVLQLFARRVVELM
jgi:hypothetical protein